MKFENSYLVTIQFLGFRFHGWQKQLNAKTLHSMIDKTLTFVFEHNNFKTLGVGRTDSKVSAHTYVFQLFTSDQLVENDFIRTFNSNLPNDIRALTMNKTTANFNIIGTPKMKEYLYLFSFGTKNHPFAAPFIVGIDAALDIKLMQEGAKLFQGVHYFHKYCTQPTEHTIFKRRINACKIVENNLYSANFFPEKSYMLRVKGDGFLRYQIRLMMGILFELGKGRTDLEFIATSLKESNDRKPLKTIAPSSGLQLYDLTFS